MSYPAAGRKYRVPNSTLRDSCNTTKIGSRITRLGLNEDEEKAVVQLMLKCADRGQPLVRQYLSEAVQVRTSSIGSALIQTIILQVRPRT